MAETWHHLLLDEEIRRAIALTQANAHCQGRFEPAAVLDVAMAFEVYIQRGINMLRSEHSHEQ